MQQSANQLQPSYPLLPMPWYLTWPALIVWIILIDVGVTLLLYALPAGAPIP